MNEIDREALRAKHGRHESWTRGCGFCRTIFPCDVQLLIESTDAQLAALRDERDRAVRCLRVILGEGSISPNKGRMYVPQDDFPASQFGGDSDYLRQLIESEEGQ